MITSQLLEIRDFGCDPVVNFDEFYVPVGQLPRQAPYAFYEGRTAGLAMQFSQGRLLCWR